MSKLVGKLPALSQSIVASTRPKLQTFLKYAKVELVPPTPAELGEASKSFTKLIHSARTGKWKQLTVREGAVNSLVAIEVLCWFFVGECLGKGSLVGYQV